MVRKYYDDISVDFTDREYALLEYLRENRQGTQCRAVSVSSRSSWNGPSLTDDRKAIAKLIIDITEMTGKPPRQIDVRSVIGGDQKALSVKIDALRQLGIVTSKKRKRGLVVDERRLQEVIDGNHRSRDDG